MTAEIYTKPNCPHCVKAKFIFEQRGIAYTEISAVTHRDQLFERVEEATGGPPKTVPQIWLDDEYIGGCDRLIEHFERFDASSNG
jgi:glutaredoxin